MTKTSISYRVPPKLWSDFKEQTNFEVTSTPGV